MTPAPSNASSVPASDLAAIAALAYGVSYLRIELPA